LDHKWPNSKLLSIKNLIWLGDELIVISFSLPQSNYFKQYWLKNVLNWHHTLPHMNSNPSLLLFKVNWVIILFRKIKLIFFPRFSSSAGREKHFRQFHKKKPKTSKTASASYASNASNASAVRNCQICDEEIVGVCTVSHHMVPSSDDQVNLDFQWNQLL
jgi:hypothetical protein